MVANRVDSTHPLRQSECQIIANNEALTSTNLQFKVHSEATQFPALYPRDRLGPRNNTTPSTLTDSYCRGRTSHDSLFSSKYGEPDDGGIV